MRHGGVRLDGGAFPQQVCADLADACGETQDSGPLQEQPARGRLALTWQVFADDVSGFYCTGHGGMDDFIKLQPQACKSETG